MAIAGIRVNTAGAGEVTGFSPLPKGKYEALIQGFEIKQENGNNGSSTTINFPFLVIAGEYKDRKLFERVTIASGNPKAVAFGMRVLNSLGKVIGKPEGEWSDSDLAMLKGKRVILDVDVESERTDPATGKVYSARNRINGYESTVAAAQQPMQMAQPQAFGGYAGGGMAPPAPSVAPQMAPQPVQQQAPMQQNPGYAQQPQQAYAPQASYAQMPAAAQPQAAMLPPQSNYSAAPPALAAAQNPSQAPTWMSGAQG